MSPNALWIIGSGIAMGAIALVGGALLLLPERTRNALVPLLVAFAAGSLLGGAVLHLFPRAVHELGGGFRPWGWALGGALSFFLLETVLRHRHHHDHEQDVRPIAWLILLADGLHNFVGGLAVGGAFLVDIRLGITVWLAEAAHEIPQELGDLALLVHGGMAWRKALALNVLAAMTFLVGGLVALWVDNRFEIGFLLAFGAGNFVYLALVDLLPEIWHKPGRARHVTALVAGVLVLAALRALGPEHAH